MKISITRELSVEENDAVSELIDIEFVPDKRPTVEEYLSARLDNLIESYLTSHRQRRQLSFQPLLSKLFYLPADKQIQVAEAVELLLDQFGKE